MMTKEEIAKEYTLTDRGTVASPGKFEGEPWYVVALWDMVLEGFADCETGDSETDDLTAWFEVSAALARDLQLDPAEHAIGSYIGLFETSNGFVCVETSEMDPESDTGGYIDCACRDCFEIAIGKAPALCSDCADAGCDRGGDSECQREDLGADDDGSSDEGKGN